MALGNKPGDVQVIKNSMEWVCLPGATVQVGVDLM